jgi:HK97 family phage portal protein
MLPLQTYRRSGDRRERASDPSLLRQPSAQGGLHDWLFRAMTSLVYRGNAVGMITARDAYEYPTSIEWLNPDEVSVDDSQPFGPGSFVDPIWFWRGRRMAASDLVHIPWFTMPGRVWGLSPIGAYASTVATGLSAKDFSRQWFDNGGVPPGTFRNTSQTVDQDQADGIKRRLVRAIRTREPIVYGSDWEYTPITVASNEAKFVETMRLGASEIAAIYGIPPEMIGGETGASMTYANVEQQSINFVQFTLLPWLKKLEDALSALLPRPLYLKFNVDALIRPDATTRYANYRTARDIGLMSIDEIRALEDMPPIPDGLGGDYTALALLAGSGGSTSSSSPSGSAFRRLEVVEGDEERTSGLQYGRGTALWKYWTSGEGLARWSGATQKWTTLRRLLLKEGVPAHEADGLTSNIIEAVMPGYMKQAHRKSS